MKSQELHKSNFKTVEKTDGFNIDLKRVLFNLVRHWYVVASCVAIALLIAFLVNRYSTRIHPVTASLIVKEADDISGAELVYNNPLLNFKRNYLNELYIIKSYPLIQKVVEDLNFDVSFFREGKVLTTEIYKELPISVLVDRKVSKTPVHFRLKVLNKRSFSLGPVDNGESLTAENFQFNDTVAINGFRAVFKLDLNSHNIIGDNSLIFSYVPSEVITDEYVTKLAVHWAEEGAGVVNLSINGGNARKQADFLDGLIAQYQENDLRNKNLAASRTVEFISGQLERISDSLRQVERQLQVFKDKNIVTDLSEEALRLYKKVEQIEAEKAEILIKKSSYNYLIRYIEANQDLDQVILPTSIGISDPVLSELVSNMNQIQLSIKTSGKTGNPLRVDAARRLEQMKKDLMEGVRNQEKTDDIKLQFLERQVAQIERQLDRLPVAERDLVSIQRNYSLQENLYVYLLQKQSEAAISKAANISDIVMVNPPKVGEAISPRILKNYLLAIAGGFFIPFLFFVFLELIDTKVQSREDIHKATSIPYIGGIGHKTSESNLLVFNQPKSALAEAFRALRSNLNYFIGQKEKGVFLVTSSISGEGKTFTSINLAAVISMSNKRTLIIGADMRRPKIFDDFGLSNGIGLSTYLADLCDFERSIQKTEFSNLDFLSGGPVPPNPSELLLSERMALLLEKAKLIYDFIIIDTPPLGIVTDALALSDQADHILFVVRQGYTPKELLRTVEDFHSAGKLKNISIVFNDVYKSGLGYGYSYSYGYGYSAYGMRGASNYYQDN